MLFAPVSPVLLPTATNEPLGDSLLVKLDTLTKVKREACIPRHERELT
jgi:hypothetical protein